MEKKKEKKRNITENDKNNKEARGIVIEIKTELCFRPVLNISCVTKSSSPSENLAKVRYSVFKP